MVRIRGEKEFVRAKRAKVEDIYKLKSNVIRYIVINKADLSMLHFSTCILVRQQYIVNRLQFMYNNKTIVCYSVEIFPIR